jgi:hypothetical protein
VSGRGRANSRQAEIVAPKGIRFLSCCCGKDCMSLINMWVGTDCGCRLPRLQSGVCRHCRRNGQAAPCERHANKEYQRTNCAHGSAESQLYTTLLHAVVTAEAACKLLSGSDCCMMV